MSKFTTTPSIFYGIDSLKQAKKDIANYGKKALIVTDQMMVQLNQLDEIQVILNELHIEYVVFSHITGEPTVDMAMKGVEAYQLVQGEFIIALGGGAVLDAAKAISMILSFKNNEKLEDFIKKEFVRKDVKVIAIPTTAGTGSEVTRFTIITDPVKKIKMLLKGDAIIPDMAIVDPQFTITMPKSVSIATGLDALCHAIESYLSCLSNPMSMQFSMSAIRRIFTNLKRSLDDTVDMEAKSQMSLAAMEAGIAFNNSSVTLIHGMSRPIGALFHIPHGNSNAMLLMPCLRAIQKPMMRKFAEIARLCEFTDEQNDELAVKYFFKKLEEFISDLGIKTLQDYGVTKEMFDEKIEKMSVDALESGSPANLKIDFSKEDIKKIYQSLYEC